MDNDVNEFVTYDIPNSSKQKAAEAATVTSKTKITTTKTTKRKRICIIIISFIICIYSIVLTILCLYYYIFIINNNNNNNDDVSMSINNITTAKNHIMELLLQRNHDQQQQENDISLLNKNKMMTSISNSNTPDLPTTNNNQKKGMYAIVHIGPHNTGSSTLQYMMNHLRNELELDQYQLPNYDPNNNKNNHNNKLINETNDMKLLAKCLEVETNNNNTMNNNTSQQEHCNSKMILNIMNIASRNQHLLISSEHFASKHIQPKLLYTLLSPYYYNNNNNNNNQIKIVIYYRRFFEWLISYNKQYNSKLDVYNRISIYDWINNDHIIKYFLDNSSYITGSYKRYIEYFPNNIHIVNMHDEQEPNNNNHLIQNFFCNVLIDANNTCEKVQSMEAKDGTMNNVSIHMNQLNPLLLFYEELSYAAIQMNIITSSILNNVEEWMNNSTIIKNNQSIPTYKSKNSNQNNNPLLTSDTIQYLTYKARIYQEEILLLKNENNFTYYKCPKNKILNKILQITIDIEHNILPHLFMTTNNTMIQENSIRNDFLYIKEMNQFCIIDVHNIILNNINNWKTFFMSL